MQKNFCVIIATAALLFINGLHAPAQSADADNHRFEVGGQFSLLNFPSFRGISTTPVPCLVPPCPVLITFEPSRELEPGFGGRLGYNVTNFLAIEAEVNFFPRERRFNGGREIQGLFGAKAGRRFEKVGVFGKIRPGFMSSRTSEFGDRRDAGCITIFPPPAACFDETLRRRKSLAVDVGGVIELYPASRMIVRLDAGDTIIRLGQRSFVAPSPTVPSGVVVAAPAETTHNFQGSVGLGFRF